MKNRMVPEIRFNGFDDEWELKKIEECFLERNERSAVGDLLSVTINSGIIKASDLDKRDSSSADKSNYKKVEVGDIAYNSMRMWQGASGVSAYDGIVSPAYTVLIPKEEACSNFFSYLFKLSNVIHAFKVNSQGLTSDTWNLKFPFLKEIEVIVPSYEEQKVLVEIFNELDNLILLRQQELDNLKQMKQGFLQTMFPKEGEVVPEIRFPGFTEDWVQRKFKDIVVRSSTFNDEIGLPRIEYEDIVSGQGTFNKDMFAKVSNKKGIEFDSGDVLFGKLRPYLQNWLLAEFKGVAVGDWWVLHPENHDSKFVYSLIQSKKYQTVANLSTGTKMPRSDWNIVSNTLFDVPKSIEEQNQIGQLFKHLDNLFANHQQELELLKATKKAFLQKMFI